MIILRDDGAVLALDLLIDTDFTPSASVAEHPIEDGSDASDHQQRRRDEFTTRVLVTESPRPTASGPVGPERITRAQDFLEECLNGHWCSVSGDARLGVLEDCLLATAPTSYRQSRGVVFVLQWVRPQRVAARQAVLPDRAPPAAVSKVDAHQQAQILINQAKANAALATATQRPPSSLLAQLFGG